MKKFPVIISLISLCASSVALAANVEELVLLEADGEWQNTPAPIIPINSNFSSDLLGYAYESADGEIIYKLETGSGLTEFFTLVISQGNCILNSKTPSISGFNYNAALTTSYTDDIVTCNVKVTKAVSNNNPSPEVPPTITKGVKLINRSGADIKVGLKSDKYSYREYQMEKDSLAITIDLDTAASNGNTSVYISEWDKFKFSDKLIKNACEVIFYSNYVTYNGDEHGNCRD